MVVSSPLNLHVEILMTKVIVVGGGTSGMWLGHEGAAFMNGISALIKDTPRSSLASSTMGGHKEKSAGQKKAVTRLWPCWRPVLGRPASSTVRTEVLLFTNHPGCNILLQKPEQTKALGLYVHENGVNNTNFLWVFFGGRIKCDNIENAKHSTSKLAETQKMPFSVPSLSSPFFP